MGSKCSQQKSKQFNIQNQKYQFIHRYSKKLEEWCQAIAINKNNQILLVGASSNIKIFNFNHKKIKYIQSIGGHVQGISTLAFMQQKEFFVSGSLDGILIVWPQYLVTSKKFTQKIKGHVKTITCVQLSLDSNIIITGSRDKTIKFWYRSHLDNQQYYLYQSINEHTKDVYGLSLNEQCNEVISCSEDKTILILEFKECWTVKQKIKGDGVRLCYLPNNVFVFQPYNQEHLEIYYLDTSLLYIKLKDVPIKISDYGCQPYFPALYNKNKQIIVVKNCSNVNLFTYCSKCIDLIESIDFQENWLYGTFSDDGDFLITYDYKSKELQIRECINYNK
ncbi:unnamed protein product [Paramecium sonneborni]|uniref:Uncharacterized protein n=1 Tax=Paramecium sonneborni TaxID=65129 RepID=A0A8S1RPT3_9CILI|nr:unnamed protein product [Paramecium sonneborni]